MKDVNVGDAIVYHEPDGTGKNGIVIAVWSQGPSYCLNLVTIEDDPARDDSYGRQIKRPTSISYKDNMPVHSNYWRWPEDEPNPVAQPLPPTLTEA